MKTFVSTAVIIGALACSACSSSASPGKESAAQESTGPQASPSLLASNLPEQFAKKWTVDECEGVPPYGTGLIAADPVEIEEDGAALKIKTQISGTRNPDPRLLHNAALTLVGTQDPASQNVLTHVEAKSLCAAAIEEFEHVFWKVLTDHNFSLTYLAGVGQLHKPQTDESVLIIFLPYALAAGQPTQFIMAVIPRDDHIHDEAKLTTEQIEMKKKNHNGIVHGSP